MKDIFSYKNLPRKKMAAGAIVFNDRNEILLVKPGYKEFWSIPGGVIEENESPRTTCLREVKEEVNVELKNLRFLGVDYIRKDGDVDEYLHLMFCADKLNKKQQEGIKIDGDELLDFKFVSPEEAIKLLGAEKRKLAIRLPKCLEAIKNNTAFYVEDGEKVL